MFKRAFTLTLLCCFLGFPLFDFAQKQVEKSVYFPVDGHTLTPSQQSDLAAHLQSLGNLTRLEIIGHTDSTASIAYNEKLSQKRAQAVEDFCLRQGISPSILSVSWKGESQPIGASTDLAPNRRVTLVAYLPPAEPVVQTELPVPNPAQELEALYGQMASDWQIFWVDPNQESSFKTRGGITFTVPSGSLPTTQQGQVKLILKEYLTLGEMLSNRITTTSNGKLLQTGGSFQLLAIQGNDTLSFKLRKPITADIPYVTLLDGMQVFNGSRGGRRNMVNWVASTTGGMVQTRGFSSRGSQPRNAPQLQEPSFWQRLFWTKERQLKYRLSIPKKDALPVNAKALLDKMREENQRKFRNEDLTDIQSELYPNSGPNLPNNEAVNGPGGTYRLTFYNLGYINCDRFLTSGYPLFTLKVGEDKANEDYSLIFPTLQSVMPVYSSGRTLVFPNVPDGLPVRLIRVKSEGGKHFYGEKAFKLNQLSPNEEVPLAEISEEDLKQKIQQQQF